MFNNHSFLFLLVTDCGKRRHWWDTWLFLESHTSCSPSPPTQGQGRLQSTVQGRYRTGLEYIMSSQSLLGTEWWSHTYTVTTLPPPCAHLVLYQVSWLLIIPYKHLGGTQSANRTAIGFSSYPPNQCPTTRQSQSHTNHRESQCTATGA